MFKHTIAARELKLRGVDKAVLNALVQRVNEHGVCWPSVATIQEDSGFRKTAVFSALKRLEARGIIKRDSGNPKKSNRYTMLFGFERRTGVVREADGGSSPDGPEVYSEVDFEVYKHIRRGEMVSPFPNTKEGSLEQMEGEKMKGKKIQAVIDAFKEAKAPALKKTNPTIGDIVKGVWVGTLAAQGKECVKSLTGTQVAQLKKIHKYYGDEKFPKIVPDIINRWAEFVEYVHGQTGETVTIARPMVWFLLKYANEGHDFACSKPVLLTEQKTGVQEPTSVSMPNLGPGG